MEVFMIVLGIGVSALTFFAIYSHLSSLDSIAKSLKKLSEQESEGK